MGRLEYTLFHYILPNVKIDKLTTGERVYKVYNNTSSFTTEDIERTKNEINNGKYDKYLLGGN